MKNDQNSPFENADKEAQATLFSECIHFVRQNKKYWLIPVLLLLLGLGALILLGGTVAAPFIYSIF